MWPHERHSWLSSTVSSSLSPRAEPMALPAREVNMPESMSPPITVTGFDMAATVTAVLAALLARVRPVAKPAAVPIVPATFLPVWVLVTDCDWQMGH